MFADEKTKEPVGSYGRKRIAIEEKFYFSAKNFHHKKIVVNFLEIKIPEFLLLKKHYFNEHLFIEYPINFFIIIYKCKF